MEYFINLKNKTKESWSIALHDLKQGDRVRIYNFSEVNRESVEIEELLNLCRNKGADLYVDDEKVNINAILKILNIYVEDRMKEIKKSQREGIEKALEKKRLGIGSYGRPSVIPPDDFLENIKRESQIRSGLENYRKRIGMKKSTFYKKIKELREG